MEHAAIPTVYNGIQMRSRLEAKWAFVFDALGLKWSYEPIDLNGWIPDFIVDDMPLEPCGNLKPEFQERRCKPFLIEIKPLGVRDEHWLRAPIDVTEKIESALGTPNSDRGDSTWIKFFDDLPYHPVLLGENPLIGWWFQRHAGWWCVAGNDSTGTSFSWVSNWQKIWKDAHNATQYKSPRK
jgi:hypothetical protein